MIHRLFRASSAVTLLVLLTLVLLTLAAGCAPRPKAPALPPEAPGVALPSAEARETLNRARARNAALETFAVSGRAGQSPFSSVQRLAHWSGVASASADHVADACISSNQGAKNAVVSTVPGGTGKPASAMWISE